MKHCKLLIAPDGEPYISTNDLREWVQDPQNLARLSRVMLKGMLAGAAPNAILAKTVIFPVWETEQAAIKCLDDIEKRMENCQCDGCKRRREHEAAEAKRRAEELH